MDAEPMTKSEAQMKIHGKELPKDVLDEDGYLVSYPNDLSTWYNKESFLRKAFPLNDGDMITTEDVNKFHETSTYFTGDKTMTTHVLNVIMKWTRGTLFKNK